MVCHKRLDRICYGWCEYGEYFSLSLTGAGVLVLPHAMFLSGWAGLFVLAFCGVISNFTANLLGEVMRDARRMNEYLPFTLSYYFLND